VVEGDDGGKAGSDEGHNGDVTKRRHTEFRSGTSRPEVRFVAHTVAIDPQDPLGAITAKPVGGWLDDTAGEEIVACAMFVGIVFEGGHEYAGPKPNVGAGFVKASIPVREAQDIAKDTVEVGLESECLHLSPPRAA
jgi:hypothetical protein